MSYKPTITDIFEILPDAVAGIMPDLSSENDYMEWKHTAKGSYYRDNKNYIIESKNVISVYLDVNSAKMQKIAEGFKKEFAKYDIEPSDMLVTKDAIYFAKYGSLKEEDTEVEYGYRMAYYTPQIPTASVYF